MKTIQKVAAICALAIFSTGASATMIEASYSVDAHGSDPGLRVNTRDMASNSFSHSLTLGESATFALFNVWAVEGNVNPDDEIARAIAVNFDFTLPEPASMTVEGATGGVSEDATMPFWPFFSFEGAYQYGELTWNEPGDYYFGPRNDGHIQLSLSGGQFSNGPFGLSDDCFGRVVEATLTLVADPTRPVPAPGALGLFVFALLGMMLQLRRRAAMHR